MTAALARTLSPARIADLALVKRRELAEQLLHQEARRVAARIAQEEREPATEFEKVCVEYSDAIANERRSKPPVKPGEPVCRGTRSGNGHVLVTCGRDQVASLPKAHADARTIATAILAHVIGDMRMAQGASWDFAQDYAEQLGSEEFAFTHSLVSVWMAMRGEQ